MSPDAPSRSAGRRASGGARRLLIEWTRASLRLAVVESRGPRRRLVHLSAGPTEAAGLTVEGLRASLKPLETPVRRVVAVIPREQVITRVVRFPTMDRAELSRMIELYARSQLPYAREHTIMDEVLVNRQDGFSTVLLVACQRELIERWVDVLTQAGLSIDQLTISSCGVRHWYERARRREGVQEPCLVINVDETRADLVLLQHHVMLSSRSLAQGWKDWELLGQSADLLVTEIDRSQSAVRKELQGLEVRSILLTGVGPLAQWREEIVRRIGLPVSLVDPRDGWPSGEAALPLGPSPVVLAGIASANPAALVDVSPPELRAQRRRSLRLRELGVVAGLAAAAMLLGAGILGMETWRNHRAASGLEQTLSQLEPQAKALKERQRVSQLVDGVLDQRRWLASLLTGVFQATPPDIALEVVNFERGRQEITVRGQAPSTQSVLEYVTSLQGLPRVATARLKYTTQRVVLDHTRTEFELLLSLGPRPPVPSRGQGRSP